MTRAQTAAWNIYITRVQAVVSEQHAAFAEERQANSITMAAPTKQHVAIVQSALDDATREAKLAIVKEVLSPIIDALDVFDRSRSKNETIKECRGRLQEIYEGLLALSKSVETGEK